jgi:hypothetical protein
VQKLKRILTHKTFQLLVVLAILTTILVTTTILRPDIFQQAFNKLAVLASDITSGRIWKEKSQARVFIEDGALKIAFTITPEDQITLKKFNQKLAIGDDYLDGLAFKLETF